MRWESQQYDRSWQLLRIESFADLRIMSYWYGINNTRWKNIKITLMKSLEPYSSKKCNLLFNASHEGQTQSHLPLLWNSVIQASLEVFQRSVRLWCEFTNLFNFECKLSQQEMVLKPTKNFSMISEATYILLFLVQISNRFVVLQPKFTH